MYRAPLLVVPTEAAVRTRVLGVVVETFDPDHSYSEAQVNALCAEWHDDWASLRRALVDEGLILRDGDGTRYRRAPRPDH